MRWQAVCADANPQGGVANREEGNARGMQQRVQRVRVRACASSTTNHQPPRARRREAAAGEQAGGEEAKA